MAFLTFSSTIVPAASSGFFCLGGRPATAVISSTESDSYWITRNAGTWTKLQAYVVSNSSSSVVVRFRKNSANGNQLISPGASTGYFEDTSNSDTVASGDTIDLSYSAANTSTVNFQIFCCAFDATTNYVVRQGSTASAGVSFTTAGTDFIQGYHEGLSTVATDDTTKAIIEVSCTVKNLYTNVLTNARTTTTTLRSRLNNADGNVLVQYTSGQTGAKEDTSNSDTVAAGNTVNLVVRTAAADSASIVIASMFADITSTSPSLPYIFCNMGTVNANNTNYLPMGGRNRTLTETPSQLKAENAGTFEKTSCFISGNTVTATTNLRARINGNPGNNLRVIPSSTTGAFTDTSNTDVVTASDLVDYEFAVGATGTNITGRFATITFTADLGGQPTMRRWGGVPFLGGLGIGQKGPGRTWGQREKAA